MKIIYLSLLAILAGFSAFAGGLAEPLVESAPLVAEESNKKWIIPLVLLGVVALVASSNGSDDDSGY